MRYLWVEDFDGKESGQGEIKKILEKYFDLAGKTIEPIPSSLEEVLQFLDEPSNWNTFDAVLIDIRFKVCDEEIKKEAIYNKYFKSFLTKTKYDVYTSIIDKNVNTASAGVLLYLALIHKYNYSANRIAFISANVDSQFENFNSIKHIICKSKYSELSVTDKNNFRLLNEEFCEAWNNDDGDFPLPETDDIIWTDPKTSDDLLQQVDEIKKQIKKAEKSEENHTPIDKSSNLKLNSVAQEFEKVGLLLPEAFEKPDAGIGQEEKSWCFRYWVETKLKSEYYNLRSKILPICLMITDEKLVKDDDIIVDGIKREQILNLFKSIIEFFPATILSEKEDSLNWRYSRIVKECVSLCEKRKDNSAKKSNAYQAVLKLARNWSSHQGINGITAFDVVFIFHIMLHTFIKVDSDHMKKLKEADQQLIKEFCFSEERMNKKSFENFIDTIEKDYRGEHYAANDHYTAHKQSQSTQRCEEYRKGDDKTPFSQIISAIGHERSPIRESVCMNHLYALYLCMLKSNYDNFNSFDYSVIERLQKNKPIKSEN